MRLLLGIILGALIGFGLAVWYQGEPPFAGNLPRHAADLTLTLSDSYLTRRLQPMIVESSHGLVRDIRVTSSSGDTAYVEGRANVVAVTVPVGVSLRLYVRGSTVAVAVRAAHLGPVPIPDILTHPLADTINARIAAATQGQTVTIVGVGTTTTGVEVLVDEG